MSEIKANKDMEDIEKTIAEGANLGDIIPEDPKWEGASENEAAKTALMPIISAFPSAMRYFSDFDLFDEDYKILNTFPCPKCGGFYLKDNRGQDGCLDCGHKIQ